MERSLKIPIPPDPAIPLVGVNLRLGFQYMETCRVKNSQCNVAYKSKNLVT